MHSFIDGSAFCPGAPKRVPSDSEKHLRVYTSSHGCHRIRVKKINKIAGLNGLRSEGVKTSADPRLKNNLRVYTASDANWLNSIHVHISNFLNDYFVMSKVWI